MLQVGGDFCIQSNTKVYELLDDMDIVEHINMQRLIRLSQVVRMERNFSARCLFHVGISGNRYRGRNSLYWNDQIEEAKLDKQVVKFNQVNKCNRIYILGLKRSLFWTSVL